MVHCAPMLVAPLETQKTLQACAPPVKTIVAPAVKFIAPIPLNINTASGFPPASKIRSPPTAIALLTTYFPGLKISPPPKLKSWVVFVVAILSNVLYKSAKSVMNCPVLTVV